MDFASGSRLVLLGHQVEASSHKGLRMAVLEIWMLGLVQLMIATGAPLPSHPIAPVDAN